MTGTVFMEDMTWPEVRDAIAAGTVRVIVIVAAISDTRSPDAWRADWAARWWRRRSRWASLK